MAAATLFPQAGIATESPSFDKESPKVSEQEADNVYYLEVVGCCYGWCGNNLLRPELAPTAQGLELCLSGWHCDMNAAMKSY
mgnify:FL=1